MKTILSILALVVGGFVLICVWAAWMWRKRIASEFAEYAKKKRPDLSIGRVTGSYIEFRFDDGREGKVFLDKLRAASAGLLPGDKEGQERAYEFFFNSILASDAVEEFSFQTHSDSIRPQLLTNEQLSGFAEYGGGPSQPLDGLPLTVVYVLDSELNMQYLNHEALKELGLSLDELHELALENLRKIFPEQPVRSVIEQHSLQLIAAHDCYDAARLLLIPGYLKEGEKLAAVIPDRDTLGLAPVPADGDLSGLRKLAQTPFNPDRLLIDQPVLVTKDGFELMA